MQPGRADSYHHRRGWNGKGGYKKYYIKGICRPLIPGGGGRLFGKLFKGSLKNETCDRDPICTPSSTSPLH